MTLLFARKSHVCWLICGRKATREPREKEDQSGPPPPLASLFSPTLLSLRHSFPMPQFPPQLTQPVMSVSDAVLRRRSADVGGLQLNIRDENCGLGWLDSSTPSDRDPQCVTLPCAGPVAHPALSRISTKHAVLLSTMHTETLRLLESSAVQKYASPPLMRSCR